MRRCIPLACEDVLGADVGFALAQGAYQRRKQPGGRRFVDRRRRLATSSGAAHPRGGYYQTLAAVAQAGAATAGDGIDRVLNSQGRPVPLQVSRDAANLGLLLNDYCVSRLLFAVREMLVQVGVPQRAAMLQEHGVPLHTHAREVHIVGTQSHQALLLCASVAHDVTTAREAFDIAGRHATTGMYNTLFATYRNAREYAAAEALWEEHPNPTEVAYLLRLQCLSASQADGGVIAGTLRELLDHPGNLPVKATHFEAALAGVRDEASLSAVLHLLKRVGMPRTDAMAGHIMAALLSLGRLDWAEAFAKSVPTITRDVHLALHQRRPGLRWLEDALVEAQLIDGCVPGGGVDEPWGFPPPPVWGDADPHAEKPPTTPFLPREAVPRGAALEEDAGETPPPTTTTTLPPPPVAATDRKSSAGPAAGQEEDRREVHAVSAAAAAAAAGHMGARRHSTNDTAVTSGIAQEGRRFPATAPGDSHARAATSPARGGDILERVNHLVTSECDNSCQEKRLAALVMLSSFGAVSTAAAAPSLAAASAGLALGAVAYKALGPRPPAPPVLDDPRDVVPHLVRHGHCAYNGDAGRILPLLLALPTVRTTRGGDGVFTLSLVPVASAAGAAHAGGTERGGVGREDAAAASLQAPLAGDGAPAPATHAVDTNAANPASIAAALARIGGNAFTVHRPKEAAGGADAMLTLRWTATDEGEVGEEATAVSDTVTASGA